MYSVGFQLSLILDHLMFWNKLVILIIHPSIYHLFIFLYTYLSTHLPIQPSTYLPTHLSIYLPIHPLDIYPYHPSSIHLPIYQSIHTLTYLSLHSSICPPPRHPLATHTPSHRSIHSSTCSSIHILIHPSTPYPLSIQFFLLHPSILPFTQPSIYLPIYLNHHPTPTTYSFIFIQLGLKVSGRGVRQKSCLHLQESL